MAKGKEDSTITLTKEEAHAVAEFIDMNLIESIRNDTEMDSMRWLRSIIHAYEKLCDFSGFVGLTEQGCEDREGEESDG